MRKLLVPLLLACSFFSGTAQAQNIKLVCQSFDNHYILYFGSTIRLTLNMTDKIAADDRGVQSRIHETGTHLFWDRAWPGGGSIDFKLDRTTLLLFVNGGIGTYQCSKDTPQL